MFRIFFLMTLVVFTQTFAMPEDLSRLMAGNKRFVNGQLQHPNRDLERRKETKQGQEPFAVIISCSDSRVSPEIIFDEGIGDVFVIRLAGNVIGPIAKESIEYAVHHLHSSLILVLGHENCGAVNAVLQKQDQDIPKIADLILPSTIRHQHDLPGAVKSNAIRMKDILNQDNAFSELVKKNKLHIYAGYYHLKSGEVEILNQ